VTVGRGLVIAGLVGAVAPATAAAQFPGTDVQRLSRTPDGGVPNGAARNPAISQDKRWGRVAAFESDASDIVPGSGAFTNVYVVHRDGPMGENGTPWNAGRTVLVSRGLGGQPANGPSTAPSLSGTSRVAPQCVAFVSAASNLVRGDTNGKPDAFVHDLSSGVTRRVSVNSRGRQSSGAVTEVAVNGLCTRVAFVSDAGDLALTSTRNRSWRSAKTRRTPAGRRQVYVRALSGTTGIDKAIKGLTFLASATPRGVPGAGEAYDVTFSNNSDSVTFTSAAGNLTRSDANGQPDVYQRMMERAYGRRIKGRKVQFLRMDTRLISATSSGDAGNGASYAPAVNTTGSVVAFTTNASNLIGGSNGHPQVVQAEVGAGGVRTRLASRGFGGPGNGPSGAASLTAGGTWVIFESAASDIGTTSNRRR
jgi:hypothetical protein